MIGAGGMVSPHDVLIRRSMHRHSTTDSSAASRRSGIDSSLASSSHHHHVQSGQHRRKKQQKQQQQPDRRVRRSLSDDEMEPLTSTSRAERSLSFDAASLAGRSSSSSDYDTSSNDGDDALSPPPPRTLQRRSTSVHFRRGRRDYDFLQDRVEDMTYSRRIALLLMSFEWYYNPYSRDNKGADDDSNDDEEFDDLRSSIDSVLSFSIHKSTTFRKASLAKAWAYFEHVTLPRYICNDDSNDDENNHSSSSNDDDNRKEAGVQRRAAAAAAAPPSMCHIVKYLKHKWKHLHRGDDPAELQQRARPGEMHKYTRLYSPMSTPMSRMGDFGLGTAMYFTNLRALILITFILGLVNIPNNLYFRSWEYSKNGHEQLLFPLKGSAICTDTKWVPCPTCEFAQWHDNLRRIASATAADGSLRIFALRNQCDGAKIEMARINFLTFVMLIIGLVALGSYQQTWEARFVQGKETARDYSIEVKNPPPDASHPDEWKRYFETTFGARVALVTIGIDNDLLVRTLVQRREVLRRLELALNPGISMDVLSLAKLSSKLEQNRTAWKWLLYRTVLPPGIPELFGRLTVLTARVQGLAQQKYQVKHVFVTFEKASTRLRILQEFNLGNLAYVGKGNCLKPKNRPRLCFRDQLLKVRQPDEPETIRWQDLNATHRARFGQLVLTSAINLGAIAAFAHAIKVTYDFNYLFGVAVMAASNLAFAIFAKLLTRRMESHFSEGDVQASIFVKLGIFRFVNTAIIITVIIPFTSQLEADGLLPTVMAVFFAELITVNLSRLADPIGHFKRHILAPRARTQDAMNLAMQGTPVELAERVTDMTKMIFLAFWYSAVYPAGLFLCAFVLYVKYYTDLFGLTRTWKRALPVGNRIAQFSRRYFISAAVVAFATLSSYAWAGFPYDNLCQSAGEPADESYVGDWTARRAGGSGGATAVSVSVGPGQATFRYCLQNMMIMKFPAIAANQPDGAAWMTKDQEDITTVFGWTSVGCVVFVLLTIVWGWSDVVAELFYQKVDPRNMHAPTTRMRTFHELPSTSTYIPEVKSNLFPYPLLACNTDGIDDEIFTWTDADHPHSYYDLTKDADFLTAGIGLDVNGAFSCMKHYRPEDTLDDDASDDASDDADEFQDEYEAPLAPAEGETPRAFLNGRFRATGEADYEVDLRGGGDALHASEPGNASFRSTRMLQLTESAKSILSGSAQKVLSRTSAGSSKSARMLLSSMAEGDDEVPPIPETTPAAAGRPGEGGGGENSPESVNLATKRKASGVRDISNLDRELT